MTDTPKQFPLKHPTIKAERLVYVLQSDWRRLRDEIDSFKRLTFEWGNLGFAVLGFSLSCLTSVVLYHATTNPPLAWVLGIGYTCGFLAVIIAILLLKIESANNENPEAIQKKLLTTVSIIESKQSFEDEASQAVDTTLPTGPKLSALKDQAFKTLKTPSNERS